MSASFPSRRISTGKEEIQQETYERLAAQINGETYAGDGSELHESAFNAGLSFYEMMLSLYQATLNLFSIGLFHLIEQQLADLAQDGHRQPLRTAMENAAPDTQLRKLTQYYRDHLNIDLTRFGSWAVIEEMRLVANATKHAEGDSAQELRRIRPELFQHPTLRRGKYKVVNFRLHLPLGGDGLYVTAEDFKRYEKAANELFDFVIEQFAKQPDDRA